MKHFSRIAAVALISLAVASCSKDMQRLVDGATGAYSTVSTAKVPIEAVVTAVSGFNSIKITATAYTNLPRCNGSNGPLCRDPALRKTIAGAIDAGTEARENLEAFARAHPGELGPKGLYDALVLATNTLTDATALYRANVKN